ncbi:NAD(P)/FAD-dependent oxidoreductase [Amycolatopsis sp. CA-230715]|uniref:NAD(P)/FAD-dependent oxidoreductase n=1 Tax=Amycolatopsis sp. CA-230715 TaxID=2745196 RepID=UPI001C00B4F3|nr:FAD-dependent oxidoreductase [Amycolatopsis sp. CA-230715]QWF82623.1 Ferredoxin--NAD(P)(+) reductase fdr [Amycolatopsis sp. CA-230715]
MIVVTVPRTRTGRDMGGEGPVVVVGASAAGLMAAEGLRRAGYAGDLSLVGSERGLPYDRPPLSKEILTGAWEPDRIRLCAHEKLAELGVTACFGVTARGLDLGSRKVALDDGRELGFENLVIATGVEPRALPGTGGIRGVHTVRTLDDVTALRGELGDGKRLVVVGAGFLGTEIAAAARTLGAEVCLVEPAPEPLAAVVGIEVGGVISALHRARGVRVLTGVGVETVRSADEAVTGVRLADGTELPADVVVVAIGAVPSTAWLEDSGLDCADGVRCDRFCAAAPGVYAAGDVANWYHEGYRARVRLEHRTNATEQGLYVARAMAGKTEDPFTPVPYFWSDQYDLKLQAFGLLGGHDEALVVRGTPEGVLDGGDLVALYRRGGEVAGVLGIKAFRALRPLRSLVAAHASWDEAVAAAEADR